VSSSRGPSFLQRGAARLRDATLGFTRRSDRHLGRDQAADATANPVLQKYRVPASNLFLMTSFAKTPDHEAISNAIADTVRAFGVACIRADDKSFAGQLLWRQVEDCMEACDYGVAVFENIDKPMLNPNVSLELGYMLARKRECLLLKERTLPGLMANLGGFLHKDFDSTNPRASVMGAVADWLQEVGVRRKADERVIVFVSGGGTCRCAMSKAISFHELSKYDNNFRVESRAAFRPSRSAATDAAIAVSARNLGEDLLTAHRPRQMGVGFLYEADLILATDRHVLGEIRKLFTSWPGNESDRPRVEEEIERKTHLMTEFFGASGEADIPDPWPDQGDKASLTRYRNCATRLQQMIVPNLRKLMEWRTPAPSIGFGTTMLSG